MLIGLWLLVLLLAPLTSAAGQQAAHVKLQPRLLTSIVNPAVSPSVVTFTATNPTTIPVVNGSSSVTVSWSSLASLVSTWNVTVNTAASTFSTCSTLPASAVTVSCSSVSGGTNGTCGSSSTLSTSPVQVASGFEVINLLSPYSVTLTFTLADSYKFLPSTSCSLQLTYVITAN